MIIKTIGSKLLFSTGLYILLYKLSVIGMLISPFLFVLYPDIKQVNDFQQPSLRTRLQPLPAGSLQPSTTPLFLSQDHVSIHLTPGVIHGQCLLISITGGPNPDFTDRFAQSLVYALNSTYRIKNVLVLKYNKVEDLREWLSKYEAEDTGGRYGTVRAAVNFDLTENASLAFLKSYGNNGRISDTDYHFSIVEIMDQLKIKFRPCETRIEWLRVLLRKLTQWIESKRPTQLFDLVFEQICSLTAYRDEQGHSALLSHGIQSATVKTRRRTQQQPISTSSLLRLAITFIYQYSFQQDHLHSSNTLWLPFDQYSFVSVKFYLLPGMLFLLFAAINILYRYYVHKVEFFAPRKREMVVLAALGALLMAGDREVGGWAVAVMVCVGLMGVLVVTGREREHVYQGQLVLASMSVLTTVYYSVYYPVWSFIGSVATMLLMIPSRKLAYVILFLSIGGLTWYGNIAKTGQFLLRLAKDSNIGLLTLMPFMVWLVY